MLYTLILSIPKFHSIEHIPIGIETKDGVVSRKALKLCKV